MMAKSVVGMQAVACSMSVADTCEGLKYVTRVTCSPLQLPPPGSCQCLHSARILLAAVAGTQQ
jgi:hypothetical protein